MIYFSEKIKVLSIGSLGKRKKISPFRREQGNSLMPKGIEVEYFNIIEHGIMGYLKHYFKLKNKIREKHYDLIHSHYGLSGMLSVMQRTIPVVNTFHGSDIWHYKIRVLSMIVSYISSWNIFISKTLKEKATGFRKKRSSIIPCGVDLSTFFPVNKREARKKMGLNEGSKYVLFSSAFNKRIKNYPLAKRALESIPKAQILELKGFTKAQVNLLMNACDVLLVTSFNESGPLVVKEAMACNLPIVSTKVGDVEEVIADTQGCYLVSYDANHAAEKIKMALDYNKRTNGREKIKNYEINIIAEKIKDVYYSVLNLK